MNVHKSFQIYILTFSGVHSASAGIDSGAASSRFGVHGDMVALCFVASCDQFAVLDLHILGSFSFQVH